jgi:hypothetical protein
LLSSLLRFASLLSPLLRSAEEKEAKRSEAEKQKRSSEEEAQKRSEQKEKF